MKKSYIAIILTLVLSLICFAGCGNQPTTALARGGVLVLSVNPEIAVEYDAEGIVTGVTARNEDAIAIIDACSGLIGTEARTAVSKLVTAIGDAGYFVEEIDGERRQITLEIESGSSLPSDVFLEDLIADIKAVIDSNNWNPPLDVQGEFEIGVTDYASQPVPGLTDYVDTDYGPGNDGVTDYNDTPYDDTDYGPAPTAPAATTPAPTRGNTDYGVTDYDDTDYGPNADGITDYNDTPYDDTDYGPNNDGVTDYNDTPYDDTDYGPNNDGVTDYNDTPYDDTPYDHHDSPYDGHHSDYSDYHHG